MRDETRLNQTAEIANKSNFIRHNKAPVKIACTIYRGNARIAAKVNVMKTHPVQVKYNENIYYRTKNYLHAEMNALIQAGWIQGERNLSDCTLYVARRMNCSDKYGEACPCPACMEAIKDAGIKKIVYTNTDGFTVKYFK